MDVVEALGCGGGVVFWGTFAFVVGFFTGLLGDDDTFSNWALRSKFSLRRRAISSLNWTSELLPEDVTPDVIFPTFFKTNGA